MVDDKVVGMRQLESYPSPSIMQSMQPAQQFSYNSNVQHAPEAYRASSQQQTSMSHAPLLPPIHQQFDDHSMQHQPQYHPAQMNGAQMSPHPPPPPPAYHPNQFQYPNGAMQPMPSNMGMNGHNGMMRFPIPPQGAMPMGAGRGKQNKDVKRRTKTGCLTCRKRRIKCDEGHPSCRNCQKSKRECMGYDPIFKPQPGPAPIQPAPTNSTTPTSKSTPSSATLPPNAYQPPHSFPATGGTFMPASDPAQGGDCPFEYGPSLDPALSGADPSLAMTANNYSTALPPVRQANPTSMEQLFFLKDIPPRYEMREVPPPNSLPPQKDLEDFYRFHYASGLDKFFETTWYGTRGLGQLQQDPSLLDFVAQCMDQMKSRGDDMASVHACQSLDARLVWQLAILPRAASHTRAVHSVDQFTLDLLPRIDTVEYMLTGQVLSQSRIPPSPTADYRNDHIKFEQQHFWHQLGRFTSIRDDINDPNRLHELNDTLGIMRGILGMMENRDVLYSLAIARHIGGRLPEFRPPHPMVARSEDPNDDTRKLSVAVSFVESEDLKGTTQVIQRICGMATRGWILQKQ